jgi:hypothetical protein
MFKYIILFFLLSFSILLNAQHQLDFFFDDGGYSKVKNEISMEFTQLAELNFSFRYEHYLNPKISADLGASYRKGSTSLTEIAVFSSISRSISMNNTGVYSYSKSFDATGGYELWGGLTFYSKDFSRTNYVSLLTGYNVLTNSDNDDQQAGFIGFIFGKKVISTPHFFLGLEFKTRALIITTSTTASMFDLTLGYGANIGYKF